MWKSSLVLVLVTSVTIGRLQNIGHSDEERASRGMMPPPLPRSEPGMEHDSEPERTTFGATDHALGTPGSAVPAP